MNKNFDTLKADYYFYTVKRLLANNPEEKCSIQLFLIL